MSRLVALIGGLIVAAGFYWFGSHFAAQTRGVAERLATVSNDGKIAWRPWNEATFAEAKKTDKLVFLYLSPYWCSQCFLMEKQVFENDQVEQTISQSYIPVKVDADQRPDISERYQFGVFPTCAILAPDAGIIGGCSYVPVDSLMKFLGAINRVWADHREAALNQKEKMRNGFTEVNKPWKVGAPSDLIAFQAEETVKGMFDTTYGGFGGQPKFFHPEVSEFMFGSIGPTGGPLFRQQILKTLDAQLALLDPVWGGFYRIASFTDWSGANYEKLLGQNAQLLENYLDAYQLTGEEKYKSAAEEVIRYIDRFLKSEQGWGFYSSQQGFVNKGNEIVDPKQYFALTNEEKIRGATPNIDKSIYTDANALAISAYLKAYRALGREDCRDYAVATLEKIRTEAEGREGGFYHDILNQKGAPFGLLADQVAIIHALLDGYECSGKKTFLTQAQRVANFVNSRLVDKSSGGLFFDPIAAGRIGRMEINIYPYITSCKAVVALMRLSYLTADHRYKDQAESALRFLTGMKIRDTDLRLADLALAYLWYAKYPAKFVIVGKKGPAYQKLVEAAWNRYYPRFVLIQFETGKDKLQLGELTFPPSDEPLMFLCSEKLCSAPIEDPDKAEDQIKNFMQQIAAPADTSEGTPSDKISQ